MGCCTARCTLITICALQLIAVVERQVFDFLGYMWTPIIGNFLHIVCVILGIFGTYQYRPRFVAVYMVWQLLWIACNAFVICLYLEVGILSLEKHLKYLTIDTGNESWWKHHGYGCSVTYNTTTFGNGDTYQQISQTEGCILDYRYIEVLHAGIQCLLAIFGFIYAIYVVHKLTSEDDSFDFIGGFDSYSSYSSPQKAGSSSNVMMQMQPVYVHHGMS
ncbi:sodium/potassium-transporting ATPase subunit beta-1-interacting protein 3-like isoform X2 [Ptychodera flava]|uniref:sodium/potassium-transporting ATPase subunit beta-1-interacting protein 3-like isoform X2 n=1 Tax=Ptychodera flava TaxID=63121 RepID=UPI00396A755F